MSQATEGRHVMVQGRIVWTSGDLFQGRLKLDQNTRQPKLNAKGEQMIEYGFGLAVPKSVLNQMAEGQPGHIWAVIHEETRKIYPSGQIPPGFAYKYKDGDGIDDKGVPFSNREGYPGCLVFACTTSIPIKYFRFEGGNNIIVPDGIKCGDYVNVQLSVKAHGAIGTGKPGLYLNPNAVQLIGYGEAIINQPSGDQIFGFAQPPLPPGASATPVAPTAGFLVPAQAPMAPPMPQGYPQPQAQPAYAPQPQGYPQQQQAPAQPHYGVLPQTHQPQGYPQPGNVLPMPGHAPAAAPMSQPIYAPPPGNPAMAPGYAQPAYPSSPQAPAQYQQPQQPMGMPGMPMPAYPQR